MKTLLNQIRDKGRTALHHFSYKLGEGYGIKPESLSHIRKAKESLSMDLPSFRSLLPYETVDENGLFINTNSIGFGFHLVPMAGADESLMKSLAELFKNKLPLHADCTVLLYKHHYVANLLEKSYGPLIERGGIYEELARLSLNYHMKAALKGYKNGRNVPAQLADYKAFIFISMPQSRTANQASLLLRDDWESELKVAGFAFERIDAPDFQTVLRTIVSPNPDALRWPKIEDQDKTDLREAIPNPMTAYEINDGSIDISLINESGEEKNTRVVNCGIKAYPKGEDSQFALWQTPDLFANLLRQEHGVQCPFLLSFTIRGNTIEKTKARSQRRAKSLKENANAVQVFINPGMIEEAKEWHHVHNESAKDNLVLLPTFYNLMLFTTKEKEREHVAKAISAYRQMGFTLVPTRCKQWISYLASLPFTITDKLYKGLEPLSLIKPLSHYNVANLLPLIGDFKGSTEGLLLPTYRHQAFFFNPFDDKRLPITNYNRLTVASPGAGKSFLQAAMILDSLSRGHQVFVIDLGDSYKHLCQLVGGTYIDATTLTLNPFTLFDMDGEIEIEGEKVNNSVQIRNLLAIMASPSEAIGEVQKAWLMDAMLSSIKKFNKINIDTVLDELMGLAVRSKDVRLDDLILLLSKFGKDGIYGYLCNSDTPLLTGSKFVVLEMGGFASNPELLTIVMFMMIVIIQGQFYCGDRRLKKECHIDEAWRFLVAGSNPIAAAFLEQGFRTARKYNASFGVITQNLEDTSKTVQGQAIAASADIKLILRQGSFKDYIEKHPDSFTPLQKTMIASFGEARGQGFSNIMIQYGSMFTFHRYFSDPYARILFSTSGDEFGEVTALVSEGVPLIKAVNQVVKKNYGEELCA